MLLSKTRLCLIILLSLFVSISFGCTTWSSLGNRNADGGLLIAKNRDSLASYEKLAVRKPKQGIPYLGLFYGEKVTDNYPYIAAGVNQSGLAVVQNEAASTAVSFSDKDQSKVIYKLLANYSSVKAVLKHQHQLFGNGLANFLIIGDKHQSILVEVAPKKGVYKILQANDHHNILYHTNDYMMKGMKTYNTWFYQDSKSRFNAIKSLMNHTPGQFTYNKTYYQWVNNAEGGFLDSILREFTVASWIVSEPNHGPIKLWVRMTSRVQPYATYQITLNQAFWKNPQKYIVPVEPNGKGITRSLIKSGGSAK